ncbi:uncharacterized protein LOC123896245 [Trifolium pratense]|uniref:uncharacterized protein LOC123896245 n=1 Tax=Trifolium pratense TaxID=57577 RepID=UPI001E694BE4|nr:uncharacterized protein LOC123896245 [Trifolium pratense]
MGSLNLKPGFSRLSKWTNDFNPYTQRQTHAQIWIRLMNFPQEYWHRRTLFEIASAIGTPLTLDDSTKNRSFCHYACVLVDMDISSSMYDEIVVERDGFAFKLGVVYERLLEFCNHCKIIGHNIENCKWLQSQQEKHAEDYGKIKTEKAKTVSTQYVAKAKPMDPPIDEAKKIDNVVDLVASP